MMNRKVLVPLDQSPEAVRVLDVVKEMQGPGAQVVLLHVIPPMPALVQGEHRILGAEREEAERAIAMSHLKTVAAAHFGPSVGSSEGWRCAVVVSRSVVQGIVDFAVREEVDLIAMYTYDRKGLAKLIKGSIAEKVMRNAPIEVKVFRPREFAGRV
jgi:nucleotide-binding universal stress UspA family protein